MRHPLLSSWHYARAELAQHHLRAFELGLISATALHAKRRMGKTEFLLKDLAPAAAGRGYAVGYCNLWQENQDPTEAIAMAIAACSLPQRAMAKVRAKLRPPVSSLKLTGKVGAVTEGGAEIEFERIAKNQTTRLRTAFDAFDKSRNQGLLLIDEAQVLADQSNHSIEKALRAMLDARKDTLKVIFTGSSEDRLRSMFGRESMAFYNWARVEQQPLLGEAFVREMTRRANLLATRKLQPTETLKAFDSLGRVPEYFRRFLSQYLANAFEGVETAIAVCKQSVYSEAGFATRWNQMLQADRLVLQHVAAGRPDLHGAKSLAQLGRMLKLTGPASRSVPQNSLKRLRERQILVRTEFGTYQFEDESFKEWVQAEHLLI